MTARRNLMIMLIGLTGLLLVALPAAAGGWVVITLETLPGSIRAGEPVAMAFIIRAHGQTPVDGLSPRISAVNQATGERLSVEAKEAGATGRYQAVVTFPAAGGWNWQIEAAPYNQTVPYEPLTVLPAASAVDEGSMAGASIFADARIAMRWSGAGLLATALVIVLLGGRRRKEPAPRGAVG